MRPEDSRLHISISQSTLCASCSCTNGVPVPAVELDGGGSTAVGVLRPFASDDVELLVAAASPGLPSMAESGCSPRLDAELPVS